MANIIGDIITYFAMTIMGILVILHAINSFTRKNKYEDPIDEFALKDGHS